MSHFLFKFVKILIFKKILNKKLLKNHNQKKFTKKSHSFLI